MGAAYARLRSFNVEHASSGPQRLPDWNPNAGGIEAFYFRDPDGHNLEVLAFPPDKGPAEMACEGRPALPGYRPHRHRRDGYRSEPAFLPGHARACVSSVRATTTAPNRNISTTSLALICESRHCERRRARASNSWSTSRRATGRPIPADTQADDLWYWQINLRSQPLQAQLRSAGTTSLHDEVLGWSAGVIAHDPDGHASLIAREH